MTKGTSFTIGFDDVDLNGGTPVRGLPKAYDDLLWKGWSVYDSQYGPLQGSGYEYGCTSGTQAGVSSGDQSCSVFLKDGSFTLDSLEMTAGWDTKLTVDIYGYREGEQVYHETVKLTDKAALDVHLGFKDVDKVVFDPGKGVPDDLIGSGDNIVFDDMVFRNVKVHEQASLPSHVAAADLQHVGMHVLV